MKLHQALDIVRGDVVAFIGAGGKTATLLNLGHELADLGWRVIATTTTPISFEQLNLTPYAMAAHESMATVSMALGEFGFVFIYDRIRANQVYGPSPEYLSQNA